MDRRRFLLASASLSLASCGRSGWFETTPALDYPGMREGHALRDHHALPPPQGEIRVDVAILGAGAAGLSCAWQLARAGHRDFLLLGGPEFGGNAAGGRFGELGYPKGAHYLPLPSMESTHLREMLADLGVIEADPFTARPRFDERILVHAPDERLLIGGQWQDGLVPTLGIGAEELAQQARFFAYVDSLREARGRDGRKLFCIPLAESSTDPPWRALDTLTFRQWLREQGYTAPSLLWYLNYCCRDDYGAGFEQVSAWAGLHYFAARGGHAANAGDGAVLTWPDGLHAMVDKLVASTHARLGREDWIGEGFAVRASPGANGVEVLCARLGADGKLASFTLKARRVVCAMPLFVAAHVFPLATHDFEPARDLPPRAPWLVSNFLLDGMPAEAPGEVLAWDNVVYRGEGLGYVVSTHQLIRLSPPRRSVFSAYTALDTPRTPDQTRRWLAAASPSELREQAAVDLRIAYGRELWRHASALEITVRGHAMATPEVGFLSRPGILALREADGPVVFAHSDLSGLSLFEEASYWGMRAADRVLA